MNAMQDPRYQKQIEKSIQSLELAARTEPHAIGSGVDQKKLDQGELEALISDIVDPSSYPSVSQVDSMLAAGVYALFGFEHLPQPQYEVWTKESVQHLASLLVDAVEAHKAGVQGLPMKIVEVGAGDGRLTHTLREQLSAILGDERVTLIGTDDGAWELNQDSPYLIENLSVEDALSVHKPDVVLVSWHPKACNWIPLFKDEESVKEFILIGDPTVTGGYWGPFDPDSYPEDEAIKEAFDARDCSHPFQRCITDTLGGRPHSKMVSFRRKSG